MRLLAKTFELLSFVRIASQKRTVEMSNLLRNLGTLVQCQLLIKVNQN